ncbi:SigE family RNA polymerase sigma factor [Nocardioides currus]|uniref:SigE family RNA polymerase sigma factor n=1 Tax=Nocardioides currus TaxID=2133958 RepID=UPI001FB00D1E|nr:SigE family RNA polymerase sigma factor [Nocardioides currus]
MGTRDQGRGSRAEAITDFDAWVSARGPDLLRLAYVLTGNRADAEDAVQDALSRALPRWDRICRADDVDAYVRRMVVNANVSGWRRFRRRETPTTVPVDGVARSGLPSEDRDALWQACRALPPDQRTAVVLRFYEDLDYPEIAALTGVREGSVRSRVSRGIATMRTALGDDDD